MASKSKRRGRVFRASCILAALIIAGSSFAWFTSKDEVTNRLSANADYDVSIVESYAPPKNFLPGQAVNKDVYATNTGSIGAFVEESVTSKLSIVKEVTTTTKYNEEAPAPTLAGDTTSTEYSTGVIATTDGVKVGATNIAITDCVELTKDEYYSAEAGSYLAFAPKGSSAKLGDIIVRYPDASEDLYALKTNYKEVITAADWAKLTETSTPHKKSDYVKVNEKMYKQRAGTAILDEAGYKDLTSDAEKANYIEISYKSDFTPDAEGLYVFRRTIDTTSMTYGEEFFTYEGYYFKDGKYYKVKNIVVTPDDLIDMVADGENTDGQLTSATADLVYEVKETVTPKLSYDLEKNRLVATYAGAGKTGYEQKAKDLDEAEHDLAVARAQLQRALQDKDVSDANVAKYTNSAAAFEAELEDVNARIAELEALLGYQSSTAAISGNGSSTPYSATVTGTPTDPKTGIDKQIDNETTAKDNAKTNAETALKNLYTKPSEGGANGEINDDGTPKCAIYDTLPADSAIDDTLVGSAKTTYKEESYYYQLLKAKNDLKKLKAVYGNDMFAAYVAEIKATFPSNTDIQSITDFDTLVASDKIKWSELDDVSFNQSEVFDNNGTVTGLHLNAINELTWKLKQAQENYDKEIATAKSEIARYKKAVENIGAASALQDDSTNKTLTSADGTTTVTYTPKVTANTDTGLKGEEADLQAELATAEAKKAALQDMIGKELANAVTATTVDASAGTAAAELKTSEENYNAKYRAYKKALDELNNAKTAYDNGGDLKIYINLSDDVVTYGGVADKWQMLPVPAKGNAEPYYEFANDTAVFYWTGILEGGETTSGKLIDSVELDKDTTQDMYKAFDFDIDVALKSAQVTYDEAGNVLAKAANDELDANVAITDPTNEKDTALTWTAKP